MNSSKYVDEQIQKLKSSGIPLTDAAWEAAKLCVGWPYIFGAKGQECTIAYRKQVSGRGTEDKYQNVKKKCQAIRDTNPTGSCSGCKWYPGGQRVLSYDCRGFTWWILKQIYNWELKGGGCTSQWNDNSNWKAKGAIRDGMPEDKLVCLFYSKDNKEVVWEHTGFGYHGETIECSAGVQYEKTRKAKWTHWAVPACEEGDIPPLPPDPDKKPTLRRGDSGPYVTLAQTELIQRGYDLGSYGADGKFGAKTEAAVKAFQRDWDLVQDGIIGQKTWAMLDSTPVKVLYTVSVPHLSLSDAEALATLYPGSQIIKEAD